MTDFSITTMLSQVRVYKGPSINMLSAQVAEKIKSYMRTNNVPTMSTRRARYLAYLFTDQNDPQFKVWEHLIGNLFFCKTGSQHEVSDQSLESRYHS